MKWVVVQTDRISHLKLYACFSEATSAWTGKVEHARKWERRAEAEDEKRKREGKGYHLRGWSLHVEEVR